MEQVKTSEILSNGNLEWAFFYLLKTIFKWIVLFPNYIVDILIVIDPCGLRLKHLAWQNSYIRVICSVEARQNVKWLM